jgi:hypothetical protein
MTDWVVYALNMPQHFLLKNSGGGCMLNGCSEGIYLSIHAAKLKKLN